MPGVFGRRCPQLDDGERVAARGPVRCGRHFQRVIPGGRRDERDALDPVRAIHRIGRHQQRTIRCQQAQGDVERTLLHCQIEKLPGLERHAIGVRLPALEAGFGRAAGAERLPGAGRRSRRLRKHTSGDHHQPCARRRRSRSQHRYPAAAHQSPSSSSGP